MLLQPKSIRRRSSMSCFSVLVSAVHSLLGSAGRRAPPVAGCILFAGTLTVALYIVTDMEYPRLGLIRIEAFDHFLADAYEQMQ